MRKRSWLIMLAGALALFSIGTASAQQVPVYKLGRGDGELLGSSADYWRARTAAGVIGVGLDIDKQVSLVSDHGLRIEKIEEGSTAEDAQLKVGDVIVAVNGTPLAGLRTDAAQDLMRGDDGQKTVLAILRASTCMDITVKHDLDGQLGMTYEVVSPVVYPLVGYVYDNSSAAKAGLKQGDRVLEINGAPMANVTPEQATADLRGPFGYTALLGVERDGRLIHVSLTRTVLPGWDKVLDFRMGPGYGSSAFDQYATITIRHLDWQGGGAQSVLDWAFSDKTYAKAAGMVLDLRGTVGSSTDSAARLAAHFLDSGTVLRYVDEKENAVVSYQLENGSLYKITAQGKVLLGKVTHYAGKVAVLVDSGTDGVAAAVAQSLQAAKRAVIVGDTTGHKDALRTFLEGNDPSGEPVSLLRTTGYLQNVDGSPLTAVTPDYFAMSNPKRDALMAMDGVSPWLEPEALVWIIFIGGSIVFMLGYGVIALAKGRRGGNAATDSAESTSARAEAPAKPDAEKHTKDAAPKEASKPEQPEGFFSRWSPLFMILTLLGILFGAGPVMNRLMFGAPIGGHAEVLVELDVDGSPSSEREKAVIASLQRELQGPVKFVTVDMRAHPEYKSADGPKKPFAVDRAPFVWVYLVMYDRNGNEVSRGGSGSASQTSLTKRDILSQIRWLAAGNNNGPVLPITRTYPAAK